MENEKNVYYFEKRRNDVEFIQDKKLRDNSTVILKYHSKSKYQMFIHKMFFYQKALIQTFHTSFLTTH